MVSGIAISRMAVGPSSGRSLRLAAAAGPMREPATSGLARAAALAEELRLESAPGRGARVTMRFAAYRVRFDECDEIDLSDLDWLTPGMSRRVLESLRCDDPDVLFNLSPAMAVTVGRMLSGPTPEQSVQMALWS